ncbi:MAG: PKD domain-containing protein, partial [Cytophagaceae bacterium]|nr:PKD domain-containing protein [Cytophagaceae bacterium]
MKRKIHQFFFWLKKPSFHNRIQRRAAELLVPVLFLLAHSAVAQTTWYVSQNATAGGDGTSPVTAMQQLAELLSSGNLNSGDIVKIAEGTYRPSNHLPTSQNTSGDVTFYVDKSVHIQGGWNSTFTDNSPGTYRTILSGDINGDDVYDPTTGTVNNSTENVHHVIVWNSDASIPSQISGVTARGGANGTFYYGGSMLGTHEDKGGGIHLHKGNLVIRDAVIEENSINGYGGAVFVGITMDLRIERTVIRNNHATSKGGGIYAAAGAGIWMPPLFNNKQTVLTLEEVWMENNRGTYGGAVCMDMYTSLKTYKSTFNKNIATSSGGAVEQSPASRYICAFCTFTGNELRRTAPDPYGCYHASAIKVANGQNTECKIYFSTIIGNKATGIDKDHSAAITSDKSGTQFVLIYGGNIIAGNTTGTETGDMLITPFNPDFRAGYNIFSDAPENSQYLHPARDVAMSFADLESIFPTATLGGNLLTAVPAVSSHGTGVTPVMEPVQERNLFIVPGAQYSGWLNSQLFDNNPPSERVDQRNVPLQDVCSFHSAGSVNRAIAVPQTPKPVAAMTPAGGIICETGSIEIIATSSGNPYPAGSLYKWYRNNVETADATASIAVDENGAGVYTVVVQQGTDCPSERSTGEQVKVEAFPAIAITAPETALCVNQSITCSSTVTGGTLLGWRSGNSAIATVDNTGNVSALSAGTVKIYCDAQSAGGCAGSDSVEITVYNIPDINNSTAENCASVDLSTHVSYADSTGYTIIYTDANGNQCSSPVVTVSGTYYIKVINDATGCSHTVAVEVEINPLPVISGITTIMLPAPAPLYTFEFEAGVTGNITGWLWDFGGGITSSAEKPQHQYTATGAQTVELTVTTDKNCEATRTLAFEIQGLDVAFETSIEQQCLEGNKFTFTNTSTLNGEAVPEGLTWQWDFGDGSTAGTTDATHSYTTAGTYTVTLT